MPAELRNLSKTLILGILGNHSNFFDSTNFCKKYFSFSSPNFNLAWHISLHSREIYSLLVINFASAIHIFTRFSEIIILASVVVKKSFCCELLF